MFARIKAQLKPRDCESEESEAWAEVSFAICKRGKRWLSGGRAGLRVATIVFPQNQELFHQDLSNSHHDGQLVATAVQRRACSPTPPRSSTCPRLEPEAQ